MVDLRESAVRAAVYAHPTALLIACVECQTEVLAEDAAHRLILEKVGWQLDTDNTYLSVAQNRCPDHRVGYWIIWCHDPDCGSCSSNDEKIAMAPEVFDMETVTALLVQERCKSGIPILGVEPTEEPASFHVNFSPDIVIPFPRHVNGAQRDRLF